MSGRDRWRAALACGLLCARLAAAEAPGGEPSPAWFEEVAARLGLDFRHTRAIEVRYWLPEIMSGGAAWLDYDGDGDLDAYLVEGGDPTPGASGRPGNRLYRNDGARFVDVSGAAGVRGVGYGMGVAAADHDDDGDVDLYVTNVGPNLLFRNEGNGRFTDVTAAAGVGHPGWGASAAFLDADGDDDLDLLVVNYIHWSPANEIQCYAGEGVPDYCHPTQYNAPAPDVLYLNQGAGTFADRSLEAGLGRAFGTGLGVGWGDFNGDRRPDVYVANDGMPNQLWINRGDGRFEDEALLAGVAVNLSGVAEAGMGVAVGDVEEDGDLDLFLTHLRDETNTLYLNAGGWFDDATAQSGLAAPSVPFTGFGTGFADFDHDGILDVYVANGKVGRGKAERLPGRQPFDEPNQLFRGLGGARFEEVLPRGGTAEALIENSRAAAFGDRDNDGDVDLLVLNNGGPARLLDNRRDGGAWIEARVLRPSGADKLGALVDVAAGGRRWRREVRVAYGYCASHDPRVHLGLGEAETIDELRVERPGGGSRVFRGLPARRIYTFPGADTGARGAPPASGAGRRRSQ